MVKGLSKRVVSVRFPESNVFEQAIFMVREDNPRAFAQIDVVSEACRIAGKYVKKPSSRDGGKRVQPSLWPPAAFMAIGASLTGAAWLLSSLFF